MSDSLNTAINNFPDADFPSESPLAENPTEVEEAQDDKRLSYSFASAHGVLFDEEKLYHKPGIGLSVLLELRRHFGRPFELIEIPDKEFQHLLTKHYQSGDGAAQRAVDEIGADADLASLIDDLP